MVCQSKNFSDERGDVATLAPIWTDLGQISAEQNDQFLTLSLTVGDSIPHMVPDSCTYQFLLDTDDKTASQFRLGELDIDHMIIFDLGNWDGSPWFATHIYSNFNVHGIPADSVRMFDWKLADNRLTVRFSLDGLGWSSVRWTARTFYKTQYVDVAPNSGFRALTINTGPLQELRQSTGRHTVFTYPENFEPVLSQNEIIDVVDAAYTIERELTGIEPTGRDTMRFVFNQFYGGAAIEGDPIYVGPGMWGDKPLWFVYFHELGHNFMTAARRFQQLYPLEMRLPRGPLPANIIFYEGWATLPAMYVYEMIETGADLDGVSPGIIDQLRHNWTDVKGRFVSAWTDYKKNPTFDDLNPDMVDGMFLELRDRFGWELYKNFFKLLRPQDELLALFNERVEGDGQYLKGTRSTFTAAMLSAAAGTSLSTEFASWGFPIDDDLFQRSLAELQQLVESSSP